MATLRHSITSVAALLVSVAILLMGNGLQAILLPVRANLETFSGLSIGILGSFYFLGFTLGCFAAPLLIARAGHIRAYLALVSLASTTALMHAIIVEPVLWWIMRAVTGFCFSVLYVIIESWLNERSENHNRGAILSIYTIINLTVITVGQMMLALSDPKAFSLFALASILVSLAGIPVAMTRSPSPKPVPVVLPQFLKLYASAPVGFIGCLAVGLANGAFWSLGPVYAQDGGFSLTGIGLFMSATVLGGAIGQWPLGRVSDSTDRRFIILLSCVSAAIAGLALSFVQIEAQLLTLIFGFCFGIFAFPLYALAVAHANDYAAHTDYVEISSGLLLVFGLGAAIGPTLASLFEGLAGGRSLFIYTAIVHVLAAAFALWRMARREAIAEERKVSFLGALFAARTFAPLEVIEEDDAAGSGEGEGTSETASR